MFLRSPALGPQRYTRRAMFALPAVPQDLAIDPRSYPATAEVRTALQPAVARAVGASTAEEYDAAIEELVETADLPPVPVDLNKVFAAFGSASRSFVRSLGEFAQMRERLGPYKEAPDLRSAVSLVQKTVFSGVANLEWSRLIVKFIECTVGLAALYTALHHGAPVSSFFTRTLAERSLAATHALRVYLESGENGTNPASTVAKVRDWTERATANGIHRPFGDHVD